MIISLTSRPTALLPFAAILLASGCFLPHPDAASGAAEPPAVARDYEEPPALPADASAPAVVPAPENEQAALAKAEEGMAAAVQQVAAGKIDYRLASEDSVTIAVAKAPDMSRRARVDANGNVALALLGPVRIGGLTLAEAKASIEQKLAKYLIDPRIALSIEAYGNKTIFVMGEVQNPGAYALPADARLLVPDAVRTAGGFTPAAAQNRARLLRYVEGESITFTVTQDVVLQPNDVVFIPQNVF